MKNYLCFLVIALNLLLSGCVPISQQIAESEELEADGFVGPLVIDLKKFEQLASTRIYNPDKDGGERLSYDKAVYPGKVGLKQVYIHNCKCYDKVKIVQDKLALMNTYGGAGSNRKSTKLLWDGKYYIGPKGDYTVDVIMFSDIVDLGRAIIRDEKVLDLTGIKKEGQKFVWINLIGYDRTLKFEY